MNQTIRYYDKNAESFATSTFNVEFMDIQNKFISLLPLHGHILDFGCGAGRDTKYFINHGFKVDAVDGSESLCRIASQNTGIKVQKMMFSELNKEQYYDGVWACSSILHLDQKELSVNCKLKLNKIIIKKPSRSLKSSVPGSTSRIRTVPGNGLRMSATMAC